MDLTNREFAVTFWMLLAACLLLARSETRASLISILAAMLHPAIFLHFLILGLYVAALASIGSFLMIWHGGLLKETSIWFIGTACVLLINFGEVQRKPNFLRSRVEALFAWTVILTFAINLSVFPLAVEIMLQPLIVFLVLASVSVNYGKTDKESSGKSISHLILALLGICLLVYSTIYVFSNWRELDRANLFLAFVLPIWMTAGVLPFIFAIASIDAYRLTYRFMRKHSPSSFVAVRGVLALITLAFIHPRQLLPLRGYWTRRLGESRSFLEARQILKELRRQQSDEQRIRGERETRLHVNAGTIGTDESGLQLDQREFDDTMRLLRRLSFNQMGWYQHQGNRYREEPFAFFAESLRQEDLAAQDVRYGISSDGQSFWASRRTVTGWVFGIGAEGPPPQQSYFEGPDHPSGPPGEDARWMAPSDLEDTHW